MSEGNIWSEHHGQNQKPGDTRKTAGARNRGVCKSAAAWMVGPPTEDERRDPDKADMGDQDGRAEKQRTT